jgi:hypothetical protein
MDTKEVDYNNEQQVKPDDRKRLETARIIRN